MFGMKTTRLAAAAAVALTVSACSGASPTTAPTSAAPTSDAPTSDAPTSKQYTVGVTVYNMSSFITLGKLGIDNYAKARNITIDWNSANDDVNTQVSQIEQLINKGVDAIIIVPVNASTLGPQVQTAKDAGIPVIAVNTGLIGPAADLLSSNVLPDDVAAGSQEMSQMAKTLNGQGNIVVLQGPLGSSPELNRTAGIKKILDQNPRIKVLAMQTAEWDRNKAYNVMKNWISAFGSELNGVVSENDDMAIGAHRALQEANINVPIVGIDGIQDGLQGVKDGWLTATSLQNGIVELAEGLAVTKMILDGEQVSQNYTYTMPPVDSKDLASKYYDQIFGPGRDAFAASIPDLVEQNIASGNLANQ